MRLSGGGRILTICFATLTQLHMRDRQTNRQTSGSKLAPSCALRSISTYKILTSALIDKSVKDNSHSHPGDHQKMHNTLMPCLQTCVQAVNTTLLHYSNQLLSYGCLTDATVVIFQLKNCNCLIFFHFKQAIFTSTSSRTMKFAKCAGNGILVCQNT